MTRRHPIHPTAQGAGPASPAPAWCWDTVGLTWNEAEKLLRSRNIDYHVTITSPPGRTDGVGELRVVAERPTDEGLLVVLAHRDYRKTVSPARHSAR